MYEKYKSYFSFTDALRIDMHPNILYVQYNNFKFIPVNLDKARLTPL